MKKNILVCCLAAGLAGCSGESADAVETKKRIAVCQEVIKNYINEAKIHARDQKRLIGTCHMSQKERSLAQWQCALAAVQKGETYAAATDKCGTTKFTAPANQ